LVNPLPAVIVIGRTAAFVAPKMRSADPWVIQEIE
jgi:hypothetical protein